MRCHDNMRKQSTGQQPSVITKNTVQLINRLLSNNLLDVSGQTIVLVNVLAYNDNWNEELTMQGAQLLPWSVVNISSYSTSTEFNN